MEKIKCEICDRKFKSLSAHLKIHNINSKAYYDKYKKKENEGICLECGKETKYYRYNKGYHKFCSSKCSNSSNIIKEKKKKTSLKNYGVENPNQCEIIKIKKKKTSLNNYGVEHSLQNKEIKEKIKQTNIERYGYENPNLNDKIKEKRKQTNIEKYGTGCSLNNKKIRYKAIKTVLDKQLPKVIELLKLYNLLLISKYNSKLIKLKCLNCNNIFETNYFYIQQGYGKCPNCFPRNRSNGEKELLEFIKSIESIEIIENSRDIISPYELDIFIPSKNISIEFNGLYWHSEKNIIDKYYHLKKTELCESKNIQLIHIFEDEWIFKNDIVRSRLKQILGLSNSKRIHARKCEIKEINSKEKNNFLNKYHIQGGDKSNIKLGAFHNDELISVMTFSHGNISRKIEFDSYKWELSRFCSNNNYHIIGIASKLLSYFKRNYEWKIIYSYSDRRWSRGNLYYKIGFELDSITKPNYWYVKNQNRIHRFNLRKKYNEPKDIPEWVLRTKEGYYRIWDCGHLKFKMENKNE